MSGVPVSCPVCGKPAEAAYRPFCSRRCADVDLGRWFNEDYRIPAEETDGEADAEGDSGGDSDGEEGEGAGDGAAKNPRSALAHRDAGGGAAGGLAGAINL